MSVTNVLPLDQVSLACLQDISLSIPLYIFDLCKYLYMYASPLHILKWYTAQYAPSPGQKPFLVKKTRCR